VEGGGWFEWGSYSRQARRRVFVDAEAKIEAITRVATAALSIIAILMTVPQVLAIC
jgi:hypothetical protein